MMHEQVHQRARRQQQVGQLAKDMRGMLREQEEPAKIKKPQVTIRGRVRHHGCS